MPQFPAPDPRTWNVDDLPIALFPFPIAHAVESVLAQKTVEARLEALFHAYRQTTITLALICLTHYFRDRPRPKTEAEVTKLLSRRMADGNWVRIVKEIVTAYAEEPQGFVLPEFVSFYFIPNSRMLTDSARLFEDWVNVRNLVVHPETDRDRTPKEQHAITLWKHLRQILKSLNFLSELDLLQPVKVALRDRVIQSAVYFRGPSEQFRFMEGLGIPLGSGDFEPTQAVLLVRRSSPEIQTILWPLVRTGDGGELLLFHHLIERNGGVADADYISATDGRGGAQVSGRPDGGVIKRELQGLFGRLGKVGIPSFVQAAHPSAITGGDPWWPIEQLQRDWVQDGYGYGIILELKDEAHLKAAIANPTLWSDRGAPEAEALALIISLHYRLNWQFWAERNQRNESAARRILQMVKEANRFQRPRLRALYALQSFNPAIVTRLLDEGLCPEHDRQLVERYVLTGKMKDYLRFLIVHGPDALKQRADAVLTELEPPGQGGIDLPLPPDDAPPSDPLDEPS